MALHPTKSASPRENKFIEWLLLLDLRTYLSAFWIFTQRYTDSPVQSRIFTLNIDVLPSSLPVGISHYVSPSFQKSLFCILPLTIQKYCPYKMEMFDEQKEADQLLRVKVQRIYCADGLRCNISWEIPRNCAPFPYLPIVSQLTEDASTPQYKQALRLL